MKTVTSLPGSRKFSKLVMLGIFSLALIPACKFSCKVGGGYDKASFEETLKEDFKKNGSIFSTISCPESSEFKANESFICKAADEGFNYDLKVTWKDDEGNYGAVVTEKNPK